MRHKHEFDDKFWEQIEDLQPNTQKQAKKALRFLIENDKHPSLRFKSVSQTKWSARINQQCRMVGENRPDNDEVIVWYEIFPDHDDYQRSINN